MALALELEQVGGVTGRGGGRRERPGLLDAHGRVRGAVDEHPRGAGGQPVEQVGGRVLREVLLPARAQPLRHRAAVHPGTDDAGEVERPGDRDDEVERGVGGQGLREIAAGRVAEHGDLARPSRGQRVEGGPDVGGGLLQAAAGAGAAVLDVPDREPAQPQLTDHRHVQVAAVGRHEIAAVDADHERGESLRREGVLGRQPEVGDLVGVVPVGAPSPAWSPPGERRPTPEAR